MADSNSNCNPMSMVMLPQNVWDTVANDIKNVKELLTKSAEDCVKSKYIESSEVRKILGVSAKTWQSYRDKRVIPFVQFKRKIFVKREDLWAFMESHKVKASV